MRQGRSSAHVRPVGGRPAGQVPGAGVFALEPIAPSLEAEWEALAEATDAAPFLRPGWITAWWSAFAEGAPVVATLRRDDGLAALLPLVGRRGLLRSPTNDHSPVFGAVAVDEAAAAQLLTELLARRIRRVVMTHVPSDELARVGEAAAASGRRLVARPLVRTSCVVFQGKAADWTAALSRNRRGALRRKRRDLAAEGAVAVSFEEGDEGYEDFLALEASGWKGRRGTAIASDPSTRQFYEHVVAWCRDEGRLRLSFLRLDGRPVAAMLGLVDDRTWWWLKAGFDEAYGRFSPGLLLGHAEIEHAIDEGVQRYDLGAGITQLKAGWKPREAERWIVEAYAPTRGGIAHYAAARAREAVRPAVRVARARLAGGSDQRAGSSAS